jgi:hypothetical protein
MRKFMCLVTAFLVLIAPVVSTQAAETGVLAPESGEDFTGLLIGETTGEIGKLQSVALSGENDLVARKIIVMYAAVSIFDGGLGGKPETDQYLHVSKNGENKDKNFFYFWLDYDKYRYTTDQPVTVAFSVYVPEDLGDDSFFCQFGLAEYKSTSATNTMYFVTNESAVQDGKGVLNSQKFLVNPREWNRIVVTMYPKTTNTAVTVNGNSFDFSTINAGKTTEYGEYLTILKVALPVGEGKDDAFLACDDYVIYRGAGAEAHTAPENALTATGNALVGEDSVYIAGEFNKTDFKVSDDCELCVVNDESDKPVKLAVWENDNPIPKYYDIKTVADNEPIAQSLTADTDTKTVTAKGFGSGAAGTVVVAEYDGQKLLGVQVDHITDVDGNFEESYPIKDYDSSKSYKSFWWDSLENMKPFLKCEF